jgi:hypothetical protein
MSFQCLNERDRDIDKTSVRRIPDGENGEEEDDASVLGRVISAHHFVELSSPHSKHHSSWNTYLVHDVWNRVSERRAW